MKNRPPVAYFKVMACFRHQRSESLSTDIGKILA